MSESYTHLSVQQLTLNTPDRSVPQLVLWKHTQEQQPVMQTLDLACHTELPTNSRQQLRLLLQRSLTKRAGSAAAQSGGCCVCTCTIVLVQDDLLHHTTAQHLHPLALEEDLQLKGGLREGEVCINPAALHITKQTLGQALYRWLSARRTQQCCLRHDEQ